MRHPPRYRTMLPATLLVALLAWIATLAYASRPTSVAHPQATRGSSTANARTSTSPPANSPVPAGTTVTGGPRPAPHIQPHGSGPSAVAHVGVTADGCNHNYGTGSQCIPIAAPGGGPESCAALRSQGWFRTPLVVRVDSSGLLRKKNVLTGRTPDGRYVTIRACTD